MPRTIVHMQSGVMENSPERERERENAFMKIVKSFIFFHFQKAKYVSEGRDRLYSFRYIWPGTDKLISKYLLSARECMLYFPSLPALFFPPSTHYWSAAALQSKNWHSEWWIEPFFLLRENLTSRQSQTDFLESQTIYSRQCFDSLSNKWPFTSFFGLKYRLYLNLCTIICYHSNEPTVGHGLK